MSFFFFIRWRKEMERMEMTGMVVGLLLFGSLVEQNISLHDE